MKSARPAAPDTARVDNARTDNGRTDNARTDNGRTDNARTDNGRTDNGRTDNARTDNARTDTARTDAPAQAGPDDTAAALRRQGYARLPAAALALDGLAGWRDSLQRIADACADLPPDPHAPADARRFRRYSHAVYLPWAGQLSWIPGTPHETYGSVTEYYQDDHNPEYPHVRRALPDLPPPVRDNPLLNHLVHHDLQRTLWLGDLRRTPLYVGLHLIKLSVTTQDEVAVASPPCLHQDGGGEATFTFAHLITCDNVSGGENVIATPDSAGRQPQDLSPTAIHTRFTLTTPLDGYTVHDPKVSHYVGPVSRGNAPRPGERNILLVGVGPYTARL